MTVLPKCHASKITQIRPPKALSTNAVCYQTKTVPHLSSAELPASSMTLLLNAINEKNEQWNVTSKNFSMKISFKYFSVSWHWEILKLSEQYTKHSKITKNVLLTFFLRAFQHRSQYHQKFALILSRDHQSLQRCARFEQFAPLPMLCATRRRRFSSCFSRQGAKTAKRKWKPVKIKPKLIDRAAT